MEVADAGDEEEHKLTQFGAALTIVSTTIGGGIVSLPYAFYWLGLIFGPLLIAVMAV